MRGECRPGGWKPGAGLPAATGALLHFRPVEWTRDGYLISTDPARLDRELVHRFLRDEAYWSPGISREVVDRSIDGSLNFGLYDGDDQVGFARMVTDRATFAYLGDVFVLPSHRGRGLGTWLVETALDHPELQGLRNVMLGTDDAHELYARFGFQPIAGSERWMARSRAPEDLYG
jgi:GNAT superfamily N-acetyltransferase